MCLLKPQQLQAHVFLHRGDVQVCVGQVRGLGEGLLGAWGAFLSPPVPGEGDAPCLSAAGTPCMCNINQNWVPCPLPAHSSPVCPDLLLSPGLSQPSRAVGCPHEQPAISSCSLGTMMHFPDMFLFSACDIC